MMLSIECLVVYVCVAGGGGHSGLKALPIVEQDSKLLWD